MSSTGGIVTNWSDRKFIPCEVTWLPIQGIIIGEIEFGYNTIQFLTTLEFESELYRIYNKLIDQGVEPPSYLREDHYLQLGTNTELAKYYYRDERRKILGEMKTQNEITINIIDNILVFNIFVVPICHPLVNKIPNDQFRWFWLNEYMFGNLSMMKVKVGTLPITDNDSLRFQCNDGKKYEIKPSYKIKIGDDLEVIGEQHLGYFEIIAVTNLSPEPFRKNLLI